jgi:GntR family transcriptional regulator
MLYIQYDVYKINRIGGTILKILISNKSGEPIYKQIKQQLKEQILSGLIKENEYLPSIRKLAKDLGISVITTTRAYNDLEEEGFIATMQGKGTLVLPKDNEMIKEQYLKKIEDLFLESLDLAKRASISDEELLIVFNNLLKE